MPLPTPRELPDGLKVRALHSHPDLTVMAKLATSMDIEVDRLWVARKKGDFTFRTPLYREAVGRKYNKTFQIECLSDWAENQLKEMRNHYILATDPDRSKRDATSLKAFIENQWPGWKPGESQLADAPVGFSYVLASARFADAHFKWGVTGPALESLSCAVAALEDFWRQVSNRPLRFRVWSTLAAAQLALTDLAEGYAPGIAEIFSHGDLKEMLQEQLLRLEQWRGSTYFWEEALRLVMIASALRNAEVCYTAAQALIAARAEFADPNYTGWSSYPQDPDLVFYRSDIAHKIS